MNILQSFKNCVNEIWKSSTVYPTGFKKLDYFLKGGFRGGDSVLIINYKFDTIATTLEFYNSIKNNILAYCKNKPYDIIDIGLQNPKRCDEFVVRNKERIVVSINGIMGMKLPLYNKEKDFYMLRHGLDEVINTKEFYKIFNYIIYVSYDKVVVNKIENNMHCDLCEFDII